MRVGSPAMAGLPVAERDRPRIGMLWGDFPWAAPPPKVGELWSSGVVARNVTRALNTLGEVVPFTPPQGQASPQLQRMLLTDFLLSIDFLWADLYPGSADVLHLRHDLGLDCPALLYAGGVMPKAAEAMLFPWQHLLTPRDQLLFSCEADRLIWHRLVRRSAMREWILPMSIDETIFHPRSPEACTATRIQHHLPVDAPLLLYVGRLNIQKNLHTLLRLFATVRTVLPTAHLCLVGEEDDIVLGEFQVRNTGYVAWLRQLAADLALTTHLTFAGVQLGEDLARLYAAADVFVNASVYHRENFGLAQAEAQACGVPVVCSAWGGFKHVVREGETGYLMDAVMTKHGVRVDWATGAQRVIKLLTSPTLHAKMQLQAQTWAKQRFSNAAFVAALAPIVSMQCQNELGTVEVQPAYEPSAFARRYEAHKRRCGWYATDEQLRQRWYQPMFQGRDYRLYEILLGPYATYHAASLPARAIQGSWVPYTVAGMQFDRVRHLIMDQDPIWPQRRFLPALAWDILQVVDGVTPVDQIIARLSSQQYTPKDVRTGLWHLYVDGIIMLKPGDTPGEAFPTGMSAKPHQM
jgi:glycosyltransferase involved in cell wall biosynthesis